MKLELDLMDKVKIVDIFLLQTLVALFLTIHSNLVIKNIGHEWVDLASALVVFILFPIELLLFVYLFSKLDKL